ncbi:MAG: hypothetical protein LPJ89_01220 [Hymenobacteraceae bacterium]|nr:hypothetical protein [Hymenobacteraceae bacterium]MDX5395047.1 hypothetical protein [Hymenobacteraceae bacterium]MDX5442383.1 hypothetical protein [Hymenobacteraceae bacterium]MDX5511083.1 hypothetical protein [Hymenobacteraceae bacterium]
MITNTTQQVSFKTYFQNQYVTISYNEEERLGKAEWNGQLQGAEYREALLLCQGAIDQFGLTKWLGDNRKMKAILKEDEAWTISVLCPLLLNSTLCRMANLVSKNLINRKAVERMIKHAETQKELIFCDFETEEEALEWLRASLDTETKAIVTAYSNA